MVKHFSLFLGLVSAMLVAGCDTPTQLLLVVDSDLVVPEELTRLDVFVSVTGDPQPEPHSFMLKRAGAEGERLELPLSLAVVPPNGDAEATINIEVHAWGSKGIVDSTVASAIEFVVNERRLVEVYFEAPHPSVPDAGVIADAMTRDTSDAGTDAQVEDAAMDTGTSVQDAGFVDAGDAGPIMPPGFVRIAAGRAWLGSEFPESGRDFDEDRHEVVLTRDYWLAETEVTQGQWSAVMGTQPWTHPDCPTCPVDTVSWEDAVAYLNALSVQQGLQTCYSQPAGWTFEGPNCAGYRLPTEAEWEFGARAGTVTAFFGGDIRHTGCVLEDAVLSAGGWYCANSQERLHASAMKPANPWGLYDVHGSVWEWVHDDRRDYESATSTDPVGPFGVQGGLRGGSFESRSEYCRSAQRNTAAIDQRYRDVGFRAARTATP